MRARLFPGLTLAGAILLVLTSSASTGQLPIDPHAIDWKRTRSIVDLMRAYGPPDSIGEGRGVLLYHWKRIVALTFADDDGVENRQKFECEVTAKVAVGGPILQVKADVANVGALAIASVGAFGPPCAKTFGLKNSRRAVAAERMKR